MNPDYWRELRVLVTGGTIDKTYSPVEGTLGFSRTNLLAMLQQGRVGFPEAQVQTVLLKDSLDMTPEDREAIAATCAAVSEPRILITHGTDTMIETAAHIARKGLPKTIVLTGAMLPYTVHNSDGLFNLGAAFSAVQLLSTGVYVGMNGRIYPWDRVRKNRKLGVFEENETASLPGTGHRA